MDKRLLENRLDRHKKRLIALEYKLRKDGTFVKLFKPERGDGVPTLHHWIVRSAAGNIIRTEKVNATTSEIMV